MQRVLLAGVDQQLRAGLAAALRAARLEVVEVSNGFAAFRSYMRLQGEVDLVVAPLHMDEYDGLALARGLATLAPRLPVLLLGGEGAGSSSSATNVRWLPSGAPGEAVVQQARVALAS